MLWLLKSPAFLFFLSFFLVSKNEKNCKSIGLLFFQTNNKSNENFSFSLHSISVQRLKNNTSLNGHVLININYLLERTIHFFFAPLFFFIQLIYIIDKRVQISCLLLFDKNEREKKTLTNEGEREIIRCSTTTLVKI